MDSDALYSWREQASKQAKSDRYNKAVSDLAKEREVLDYLRSNGKDGAARRVENEIKHMESNIIKFKNEMTN